ncbi:MAG: hypothetical protein NC827_01850 [Candidatus Omnitrophica bacterium]|nr:hypothetical protein [Candidatus Omnitrophota bacterium]MCM8802039.1 hypothetical protein [Candidatus Omnitrophota bacterium]
MKLGTFKEKLEIKQRSRLIGYPNTEIRFCRGSKGDIEVNGIILKEDKKTGCLISIDILGINLSFTNKIREWIEKNFKIPFDNIVISCTHTHSSGASLEGRWGKDEIFLNEIENKIKIGVEKGFNNLQNVEFGILKTEVDISHNRRVVINGKGINEWQDIDGKHIGIIDKEIICIGFFRKDETLKSILINYSCHPVVLGPSNYYASADFVGYLRNFLEKNLNIENVVYITGASGNINPKICITDDFEIAKNTGEKIGNEILKNINNFERFSANEFDFERKKVEFIKKDNSGIIETEIQILKINNKIFLITLPGEPVVEIGLEIKNLSKFRATIIAGYTNDYIGYIATNKILSEGGHEANSCPVKDVEEKIKKEISEYINVKS